MGLFSAFKKLLEKIIHFSWMEILFQDVQRTILPI